MIGFLLGRNHHDGISQVSGRRTLVCGKGSNPRLCFGCGLGSFHNPGGGTGCDQKKVAFADGGRGGIPRHLNIQAKMHQPHRGHPQHQTAAAGTSHEYPVAPPQQPGHRRQLLFADACGGIRNLPPRTRETLPAMASPVTSEAASVMTVKFTSPPPEVGLASIVLSFAVKGNANSGWFKLPAWGGRCVNRRVRRLDE